MVLPAGLKVALLGVGGGGAGAPSVGGGSGYVSVTRLTTQQQMALEIQVLC